ncbi:hypothetical protein FN846DRAFT_895995 [Sphaerosporella brunnea]|uniref:Uncharacterized protein n=1 Tax=Sphaerosporella brunnea TaxID=1250544 RepID=A0A5J5EEE3_9PEZI|nr:hypothetical protein FN846DRAFT_895995 [Sphaerosporella brunnea]
MRAQQHNHASNRRLYAFVASVEHPRAGGLTKYMCRPRVAASPGKSGRIRPERVIGRAQRVIGCERRATTRPVIQLPERAVRGRCSDRRKQREKERRNSERRKHCMSTSYRDRLYAPIVRSDFQASRKLIVEVKVVFCLTHRHCDSAANLSSTEYPIPRWSYQIIGYPCNGQVQEQEGRTRFGGDERYGAQDPGLRSEPRLTYEGSVKKKGKQQQSGSEGSLYSPRDRAQAVEKRGLDDGRTVVDLYRSTNPDWSLYQPTYDMPDFEWLLLGMSFGILGIDWRWRFAYLMIGLRFWESGERKWAGVWSFLV